MSSRLADGCTHVFLDVGANRGVHVRFLTEPHLFPSSSYLSRGFFARYFGSNFSTDPAVCAFGFEPNAAHAPRLQRLAQLYRSRGRRVEFFSLAAEASAGVVTMYNHRDDASASDWRFGTKRPSHRPVNVSAIDLGRFVRHELAGRALPPARGVPSQPPSIVMKLDVEGDELSIFESMIESRAICELDLVTWEIHAAQLAAREMRYERHAALWDWIFEHQRPEDEDDIQAPRLAQLRVEWERRRARGATRQFSSCRTRLVATDDESYLMVPDVPLRPWERSESRLRHSKR
ncbi:hypothetical protein AB1Y20_013943 [Prymnesium parvum]|uniref:Methyltransferase FkbM domain-containing protein n=1 Tax=Prymnesium parvum TaxID=97485 RepID=A0AB34IF28_PRYPA